MSGSGLKVVGDTEKCQAWPLPSRTLLSSGDNTWGSNQQHKPRYVCATLAGKTLKAQGAPCPSAAWYGGGGGGEETESRAGWEDLGVFMEEAGWSKDLKNG